MDDKLVLLCFPRGRDELKPNHSKRQPISNQFLRWQGKQTHLLGKHQFNFQEKTAHTEV
jgi:hypothetical protein